MNQANPFILHIAAALILDVEGRLLLVRKRGTERFMQAGGKLEPGEPAEAALRRELHEELGQKPTELHCLGECTAPAANEPGYLVHAHLFLAKLPSPVAAAAEIAELRWVTLEQAYRLPLAALTRDHVLPLARRLIYRPTHLSLS
ncbi:NUDIX domain-containing protein [Halomonas daqingensis]|uniref:NUDIX domain-containing protein n=1 Tax=Billgrantia desiderata TaxID=52021 RepID=A0AAW4YZX5_9GAMM|nr:NUDIX domain-containing protein [Halomonas desiderata]MCE8010112.1 NUDIX domain-containing protein [Halomonas desiderata]MCE8030883.1 NUDIX domain-containing protein [Halomonas desiderata]MCE8043841.1 NUDIX domain-containing protein [Halomonas desiderata]MCE8048436.1 NUDIX domain-containing protein [Halomonas desiderata]MCE8053697.1 NUDIX domain-containing protein [Halomonas desiderata]